MSMLSLVLIYKGVSEDQLKSPFSSDHANEIAHKITAWKSLAPYIGLDEADEEEIQEESTSIRQKVKLMRVWKRKHGEEATYLRFVKGCEQLQRRDLVEAVCDLVTGLSGIDASGGSVAGLPRLDQSPKMFELLVFTGRSGRRHRVLDRIAPYWEEFAFALQFETYVTEAVKKSCMFQVDDCCRTIIQKWIQGGSPKKPVTWDTFLSAMEEVPELAVFTHDLRTEF